MRTPTTIWESASRPLFVRSVWLETTSAGREGHQRHFILDYEPRQPQQRQPKSVLSSTKRRDNLRQCMSYDYADSNDSNGTQLDSPEELMLIGSGKVPLHHQSLHQIRQQQQLQQQQQHRYYKSHRRQSCGYRRHYGFRRASIRQDLQSRRSSLQDLQASLSNACINPDERLAERVLNWLDLAGKTDFLKDNAEEPLDMQATTKKIPTKTPANNGRSSTSHQSLKHQPRSMMTQSQQRNCKMGDERSSNNQARPNKTVPTSACAYRHNDSVKHITIIFNKEGVPVRFNRPVRNIDLCALASSAGTTRRMAGNLASARLYSTSAECGTGNMTRKSTRGTGNVSTRRCLNNPEDTSRLSQQNRFYDESFCGNTYDAKKQLHIFMPSLPKKGLQLLEGVPEFASGAGDDGTSLLSNHFSELCQV